MNAATMSAMTLEALILGPVYTGKSMAGLVALARDGVFHPGARVLFVHTGGLPAEFGYERTPSEYLQEPARIVPPTPPMV